LKRGTGRHAHVILVPQPSDDPRDPLNWPRWKKEACFWTLAFTASLDGALSPMVGPGYVLLAKQFGVSVDTIASGFGSILLGLGCFMLAQNALAAKFGHRIVYLCSVFLMFVSCVWCAVSPGIPSIQASRVFQGFGMSALQSLVASTIEQTFFVHERGSRSVAWSFSIMAGITLGPLLYSYVVQNMSWQMGFWFVTIPLGIAVVLVFFFVPETTYIRETQEVLAGHNHKSEGSAAHEKRSIEGGDSGSEILDRPGPPDVTYLSQLRIWNGVFTDVSLLKLFLRPLPFLLSPVVSILLWFIFSVHGMQTVWLSLMPICSSTIFTIEYNFTASQIGLTNLGGLVGIVLATIISGPLTDWGTVWLAKRNKGIYEPEFRIFFISAMLLGVFGYAGWAVGTTNNMPWIGAVACIAMANFSMIMSGSAAVTYLLDTHGPNALHVL
ncbi:MFS general substrate transporter, partial [Macrolepiota fuliginosa MF-IS2]